MTTTRSEFEATLAQSRVVTVIRSVFLDSVSPAALYDALTESRPGTFLLESAEQGGIWSRYSFIGLSSYGCVSAQADATEWIDYGLSAEEAFGGDIPSAPLDALDALYARWKTPDHHELPPLTSGLVGFIGWDAIRQLENLPDAPPAESGVPSQSMLFVRDLLIIDHRTSHIHVCTAVLNTAGATTLWDEAQERLSSIVQRLTTSVDIAPFAVPDGVVVEPSSRSTKEDFLHAIARSKRHIVDGDVFQVVISQRFDTPVTARPLEVYRMLRALNPSPYMYLLSLETPVGEPFQVVGSSPEALIKVEDGRAFSHPIAGSRPRGATPEDDVELAADLLADAKERAEHLMLVDLARNDLSRVC